eukprot:TRINITY_DN676_c1_g1_i4.p4 TRINITY_DN676_c1_g1~~TRINITY_DN676_c1_g1_i4.p4  ORF type:complete len:101 (-),score=35.86 TRINITY_DN676_c1_g1_i4:386-688(-)
MWQTGMVSKNIKYGVKLLADGHENFTAQGIKIEVAAASKKAIEAIEANGGSVEVVYRSPLALKAHLKPEKWIDEGKQLPRNPPPPQKMIKKMMKRAENEA